MDPGVRWVTDHYDVTAGGWAGPGPDGWCAGATAPLLVAHEWLDDLPVPVVERRGDAWHEVEVDPAGDERGGGPVGPEDRAWLARWWERGRRAEVGRVRDAAWAGLVRGLLVAESRPAPGAAAALVAEAEACLLRTRLLRSGTLRLLRWQPPSLGGGPGAGTPSAVIPMRPVIAPAMAGASS